MQVLHTLRKYMNKAIPYIKFNSILFLLISLSLLGCRGMKSEKTPIHPNLNMDQQDRKEAQEINEFFDDKRSMRMPVAGTVARGLSRLDKNYYEGVEISGDWVAKIPIDLTKSIIYRGKERYEIYCAPCHGNAGDGQGIIMTGRYGYVPAPTFHQDRLREAPDGEIYSAIYNGVRSMPSYRHQVPVEDRWAIVAYIRALQASQNAKRDDLIAAGVDVDKLENEFEAEQKIIAEARAEKEANQVEIVATVERGMEISTMYACQTCHSSDGTAIIGPSWKNLYGSEGEVTTEDGEIINVIKEDEYLIESIVNPYAKIVDGYDPLMADAYGALSKNDLQSLIEYIKSLSDN